MGHRWAVFFDLTDMICTFWSWAQAAAAARRCLISIDESSFPRRKRRPSTKYLHFESFLRQPRFAQIRPPQSPPHAATPVACSDPPPFRPPPLRRCRYLLCAPSPRSRPAKRRPAAVAPLTRP
ncbi:hypothetical protein PVAP13_5NG349481 [Panicum virgatum]|uniref:Uncharacterized protein n=1 Tax=Panicum virgatum TaxID=38727 RepID=A0A8T0RUX8_PANVG|nr:hypothetical protein PVAP13_5NG349481 [Panicum virgatum]